MINLDPVRKMAAFYPLSEVDANLVFLMEKIKQLQDRVDMLEEKVLSLAPKRPGRKPMKDKNEQQ